MRYERQTHSIDPDVTNIYDTKDGHRIAYIQKYSNLSTELTLCPRYWEGEATVDLIEFLKCLQAIELVRWSHIDSGVT